MENGKWKILLCPLPFSPFPFLFSWAPSQMCSYRRVMAENINAARAPITNRILWYWLPVAMMFAVMYYLSTDVFSGDNTRSVIDKILLWFSPHASKHTMATFNYVVRKSAHFTEYAILGALLFRAFRAGDSVRWRFRWALYS